MKKLKLTPEKLEKIINDLDDDGRNLIKQLLIEKSARTSLRYLGDWLNECEEDCPVNALILQCVMSIVEDSRESLSEEMRIRDEVGEAYTQKDVAMCIIKQIRQLADTMEFGLSMLSPTSHSKLN